MAERLFRRLAPEHDARSAGSSPTGGGVHPQVLEALAEVGIDAADHVPRRLDDSALEWADVVVATCDDACPVVPAKRYVSWKLPDPIDQPLEPVRELRNEIDRRVRMLVADLS
jgi:arsenate reductase